MNRSIPSCLRRRFCQMAAVLALAIGCLAVWAVVSGWLVGVLSAWERRHTSTRSQSFSVHSDGRVLIATSRGLTKATVTYRSLDGGEIDAAVDRIDFLSSAWLGVSSIHSRRSPDLDWSNRILGAMDERSGNLWYLVHNGRAEQGRAYVVGYDPGSDGRVGFLGTRGFRQFAIPAEEQFSIDGRAFAYASGAVVGFYKSNGELPRYYPLGATSGLVHIVSLGALWELDLRGRTVRHMFPELQVSSVDMLSQSATQFDIESPSVKEQATSRSMANTFAIRAEDHAILYDPRTKRDFRLRIPEALRDESFEFYSLDGHKGLAIQGTLELNGNGARELTWFDAEGHVEREQHVQLESWEGKFSFSRLHQAAARTFPFPLGQLAYVTSVLPDQVQIRQPELTYGQSLARAIAMAWPQMLAIAVVSGLAAGIVVLRQRRFHRPDTAHWATLVFLLGPLGLLAYWLYFPRPPEESCEHCGQVVPRNRDACVACQREFPPASLHGIEIFA